MRKPLSSLDANFWSLDTPTTHQAIASLCLLDRAPSAQRIVEAVESILARFPRLSHRIQDHRAPRWEPDPKFEASRHVAEVVLPSSERDTAESRAAGGGRAGGDRDVLLRAASEEFSRRLESDRPPWRITIVRAADEQQPACLLFMLHHAFSDGIGGMELFHSMCSDARGEQPRSRRERASHGNAPVPISRPFTKAFGLTRSILKLLLEGVTASGPSPLIGKNSARRTLTLVEFDLSKLRRIKRALGGTLNEVMLAAIAGAARKYHRANGAPPNDLRVIMPVSLRDLRGRDALGNHLTGVGVTLPLSAEDPLERFEKIRDTITQIKADGSFGAYSLLASINARLPDRLRFVTSEFAARRTSFICTSVPGARRPLYIGGAMIESEYGLAALMRGHGIAYAFTRYADRMCCSIVSDPAIVSDPERLAGFLEEAVLELIERSAGRERHEPRVAQARPR